MADASTIDALRSQFQSRLAAAATDRALKALDDEFLSRKSGSVTALMQTLKSLPQEERRAFGAAVNALKTEIEGALQERRAALESSRPPAGSVDVTLPGPRARRRAHPPADARAPGRRGHLQPHGLRDPRGARGRGRLPQLRSAQHAAGSSRARHAGHALPGRADRGRHLGRAPGWPERPRARGAGARRDAAAHAHLGDADPLHEDVPAAGAHPGAGPRLPPRQPRPHAHADVPAVRGPRGRRRRLAGRPEGHLRSAPHRPLRRRQSAAASELLPLHRAERRDRHLVQGLRRRRAAASASTPAGSRSSAAAWCTPRCSRPSATTPRR